MLSLSLRLLSGNKLSGSLPEELGNLQNLVILQLDLNAISGSIPKSFAKFPKVEHFHMNDNSISGQIPPELSALPQLKHFLVDNNNLSGYLPPELAQMPSLKIFQLDNNNFEGTEIPPSYSNMTKLFKLSLRNCNLQGTVPDLSTIPELLFLDLSRNHLTGNIPTNKLSDSITTIILSGNNLNGSIPSNFSALPNLQKLSLNNNRLSGFVPTTIWENMTFSPNAKLRLNFQRNLLSDIFGTLAPPPNVDIMLHGNPVCGDAIANERQITQFCKSKDGDQEPAINLNNSITRCVVQQPCSEDFEYVPTLTDGCFCAAPFGVGLCLRSPCISDFLPHYPDFEQWISTNINLSFYQIYVDSVAWQTGSRLMMFLKFFPPDINDSSANDFGKFNDSEVVRIANTFATFGLTVNDIFGPYDVIYFSAMAYNAVLFPPLGGRRVGKGPLIGAVIGSIVTVAVLLIAIIVFLRMRRRLNVSKAQQVSKNPMRIEGVKAFSFKELEVATSSFSSTTQIGQGGYGNVYKGILAEGTIVAIKRAHQGSLQGEREFYTEIELLTRVHHRNLVSLVGYCNEGSEQMLVYEFMPNGSLHDLLSDKYREPLSLRNRIYIALGAARGILYLHIDADPPIIHRDIKPNNILLDSKFTTKVSDFGISKLAPLTDAATSGHISTVVKGTPGYLDPEYFLAHKLTQKSDVYSLGIVFLELLTGMRPISHGRNIVREVNAACQSGEASSIIDKTIGPYSSDCVKKFLALACRCSLDEQKDRPTMLEVVRELENITNMLPAFDSIEPELDVSTSRKSSSSANSRNTIYSTIDFQGSELVSGVFPSIRPR